MALTTIPSELSSVSGITDSSDATAITIDSSENVKINQKLSIGTTSTEGALNLNTNTNLTWGTDYSAIGSLKNSQGLLLGNNIKAGATNNTVVRHANGTDAGNFIKLAYNKGVTFHTGITTTLDAEVSEDSNERVRIDTTGKVGIGTNAPTHMLHIVDGNNYAVFGDTQSNSTMSLRLCDSPTYPVEVQAYGNDLRINTASSANATPTVKMLVQYTGYVGIGETSPDNKLHITGGDWNNAHIRIERTDVGGSNDPGLVFKSAAGANADYGLGGIWFQNALDSNAYALIRARTDDSSGTSGRLDFITSTGVVGNATAASMTIKSDGKVGIGETSPTRLFVVKRSDSAGTVAEFENTGTSSYIQFTCNSQADNAAGYVGYNSNKDLTFWTDDTQRLTIDEIGMVGIKRTPENAYSPYTSIEFGQEGAIFGNASGTHVNLAQNVYLDGSGTWKAKNTNASCLLQMQNGEFQLYNGAQVSADATVSWVQRLTLTTAGALLPGGDSTQNLGSTSKRWDNLYVNDMHFSNEGSDGNDVDGTTGDWTLQEGEEHLYIINNKSGKKFKFSLEEVE